MLYINKSGVKNIPCGNKAYNANNIECNLKNPQSFYLDSEIFMRLADYLIKNLSIQAGMYCYKKIKIALVTGLMVCKINQHF